MKGRHVNSAIELDEAMNYFPPRNHFVAIANYDWRIHPTGRRRPI